MLFVGEGDVAVEPMIAALKRRKMECVAVPSVRLVATAIARAPHLIVAIGDAAEHGGKFVLDALTKNRTVSRIPVAVVALSEGDAAEERVLALKMGAIAVLERSSNPEKTAARVAELVTRIVHPDGEQASLPAPDMTPSGIEALIASVVKTTPGDIAAPTEASQDVKDFFSDAPQTDQRPFEEKRAHAWQDARVLLIHDDAGRADALAQEIRVRGGLVVVSGRSEEGLARASELDPEIIFLDAGSVVGRDVDIMRLIERHPRLRWATRAVVRWDEVWPVGATVAHMDKLAKRVVPAREDEEQLTERGTNEPSFDMTLEPLGPCRLIRALARSSAVLQVTSYLEDRRICVDISDGLVAGVSAFMGDSDKPALAGLEALAVWMEQDHAKIAVETRTAPAYANVLLPVEVALASAWREYRSGNVSAKLDHMQKTRASVANADPAHLVPTRRYDVVAENASQISGGNIPAPSLPQPLLAIAPTASAEVPAASSNVETELVAKKAGPSTAIKIAGAAALAIGLGATAWFATQSSNTEPSPSPTAPRAAPTAAAAEPAEAPPAPGAHVAPAKVVAAPVAAPTAPATAAAVPPTPAPATQVEAPSSTHMMEEQARGYLREGHADLALPLAQKLVAARRKRADYRVFLGDVLRTLGNGEAARDAWHEALELEPNNAMARARLGN